MSRPTTVPANPEGPAVDGERLRIAVLLDHMNFFGGGYEAQIRESFDRCCRRRGHHLLLVYGRGLPKAAGWPDHFNFVYDLIGARNVDAVVVVGSSLAAYGGVDEVAALVRRFEELPRCSLGLHVAGVPSIEVDQAATMEALVRHLVVDHGCRRFAYLSGPTSHPDAMLRLRAFRRVLTEQGLKDDPDVIRTGDFSRESGRSETEALLAQRINDLDAVVAANDAMALGAVEALREAGLRVPHDVRVTGFDNVQLARLGSPSLTTVAQPFDELADAALDCLLRQRLGAPVANLRSLKPRLLRRRSCGCSPHHALARKPRSTISTTPRQFIHEHQHRLIALLAERMGRASDEGRLDAKALVELLYRELTEDAGQRHHSNGWDSSPSPAQRTPRDHAHGSHPASFTGPGPLAWGCAATPDGAAHPQATHSNANQAVRSRLRPRSEGSDALGMGGRAQPPRCRRWGGDVLLEGVQVLVELAGKDPERHRALQDGIAMLRHEFSHIGGVELEQMWFDALNIVATGAGTVHARNQLDLDAYYLRVVSGWEALTCAFDAATLKRAVLAALPEFGVSTASIARFPAGVETHLVPFVTLRAGTTVEDGAMPFPAHQLFHQQVFPLTQRTTILVLPLGFENRRQGIAAFEYVPHQTGHQMLRDQLSAAIRMVELHKEVIDRTKHSERIAQERLATARRMQALSVLSGGVAHDLNNALGPLAALPDVILRELQGNETVSRAVRDDLHTIKIAASRASQTIKDLLTLGRQGRTERKPRDFARLLREFIGEDLLRNMQAINPYVRISVDLRCETCTVMAATAQLERAISNLIRNGVESIAGRGEVRVVLEQSQLSEAREGYETVPPGRYAVLHVVDSGEGIAPADLLSVFEPFFSRKSTTDSTGSGLGLAIVHSVVKEHAGFVDVRSRGGAGTQFTLYFPVANETPKVSEPPRLIESTHAAKILLVDDEPVQLRTGRRVLRHLGYEVDVLDSGRLMLERLRQRVENRQSPYDLLILDMLLGEDKDGLEVFELARAIWPEQRGIIVSGHASAERMAAATRQGLRWLSKPYTAESLAYAVRHALS